MLTLNLSRGPGWLLSRVRLVMSSGYTLSEFMYERLRLY